MHSHEIDNSIHSWSCPRATLILLLAVIIQNEKMWAIWTSCRIQHIGSLYEDIVLIASEEPEGTISVDALVRHMAPQGKR